MKSRLQEHLITGAERCIEAHGVWRHPQVLQAYEMPLECLETSLPSAVLLPRSSSPLKGWVENGLRFQRNQRIAARPYPH